MDNAGYLDMCGHGVISVTTALIETGMIPPTEPETTVVFDTPAGIVESHARVEQEQVIEVSVSNVPAFLYAKDVELELPERGKVRVDVAFGGNFFVLVRAQALGLAVQRDHMAQLLHLGLLVRQAVNAKVQVRHPTEPHIATVALTEIYDQPLPSEPFAKSVVIFGHGQLDRSPCGTGISATMATLYARGELALGARFTSESIIGTRFTGLLRREVPLGQGYAVDPVFTGAASIIGLQQFVVDPRDPVKYGFTVHSTPAASS
jgi:proline racemase/trans-L-3-hydroxyproline dehydratase